MFRWFRRIGFLEGLSFLLLLLVAMPLKYLAGKPEAVRVIGMAHGVLFILYVLMATTISADQEWSKRKLFAAYLGSFLPLGTWWFDRKYLAS